MKEVKFELYMEEGINKIFRMNQFQDQILPILSVLTSKVTSMKTINKHEVMPKLLLKCIVN